MMLLTSGCESLNRLFPPPPPKTVSTDSYCYEYHQLIRKKGDAAYIIGIKSREIKDRILANEEKFKKECPTPEGTKK